jgi:hypothetical protein
MTEGLPFTSLGLLWAIIAVVAVLSLILYAGFW